MNIRPFDWHDLPLLYRYRQQGLFLDSMLACTRGTLLAPSGALLAYFAPATGVFTYLGTLEEDALPLVGQVQHNNGATFARLTFLAPGEAVLSAELPALFDVMAVEIGQRGAFHALAEVEEGSPAFLSLHQSGFAIYARQRIWRLEGEPQGEANSAEWQACNGQDTLLMRSLYAGVVPGLVQQVEALPRERLKGMVLLQRGEVCAYVELRYGPAGIWAQPFVHPDTPEVGAHLVRMLQALPNRRGRAIYLCVRGYQSWLEPAIEALGAEPGQSQAVLVRHLAVPRKATQPYALPALNGKRVEPVAQINDYPNTP